MWWLKYLEGAFFVICLYLAYIGCIQYYKEEQRHSLTPPRDKVVKSESRSHCNEKITIEPELPSYSEVVHS